ncbi:ATP-binding cassette domain-containing protein [Nostoc sp. CENA67]|uniref:ATP-binding cassette domain-containing protein n=1 Tax=Amazonocrinis nigriterrae CENA67 TaxID=2794033 RepID=A0A8J7L9Z5_9NOST|nr:ATP-binding cassette domain-containing protein [Amazonocrinis nigriterrae]MBH8566134.1 ATP-binding cassette domain-containing protein [Amazonocrinis nigriterrae CENA67]
MIAAVELENLCKKFTLSGGWGRNHTHTEIVAVDDISLSVPDGQAIAFIGPNGAGKSTTIKMLTGILQPTSGTARLLGLNPWRNRRELAYQMGVVFGQRSDRYLGFMRC